MTDRTFIYLACTSLQPPGECHCWWTRVSPRAHVAKFYVLLQLIRSVLRASKFSVLKFIEIVILWIYYMASPLASASFGTFVTSLQLFKLLCLAKNHWWGFCTRNAHMVHIVNEIRFKMMHTSWSLFIFQPLIFGVYVPSLLPSVCFGTFVIYISFQLYLATLFG